jgi:hypothetical protein
MYQPANRQAANTAFVWPALLAASTSEMAAHQAVHQPSDGIGRRNGTATKMDDAAPGRAGA